MRRNVVIICVLVLIIVIATIIGITTKKNNEKLSYNIEVVKNIDYMLISENNKMGVINKRGEVVVSPIYDEIQIPNPSKPLFICMYDYNEKKQQYNIKVLNDKAEQILYQYIIVEAIKINSSISSVPYEKSVLKYMDDGKYGLIDFQGNIIVKAKYEEIAALDYREGLLLVKNKGKYGVININGSTIIKEKFDIIKSDGYYEEGVEYKKSGFIVGNKVDEDYKYGYIDYNGKTILKNKYNQIERIDNINKNEDVYLIAFENNNAGFYINKNNIIKHEYEDIIFNYDNNCFILQKNSKQGVSDINGNIVAGIKYDNVFMSGKYINAHENGKITIIDYITKQHISAENIIAYNQTLNNEYTIVLTKDEKYKILNNNTNEFSKKEYNFLEYAYSDYFIVNNGEKYGVIDSKENIIIDLKYDFMQKITNTDILEAFISKNNETILFKDNKEIISVKNAKVFYFNNYINLQTDKDCVYVDYDGNVVENIDVLNKELYATNKKGKWGFSNKNKEILIDLEYDFVTEFNEYGFAGVKKDGKWGCVNSNGEVVLQPQYELDFGNPFFVGKYYRCEIGYGDEYFLSE